MIHIESLGYIIYHIQMVFLTDESLDSFFWYFFIILLIIGGIIIGAIIYYFSKKPDNWEHEPVFDKDFQVGRLKYFSDNIRNSDYKSFDNSQIKNHIQNLFFEKVRSIHGINPIELNQLKQNNPDKLRNIIKNEEIYNWIIRSNNFEKKEKFFDRFKENKELKRQEFYEEINKILDKMEVWGK